LDAASFSTCLIASRRGPHVGFQVTGSRAPSQVSTCAKRWLTDWELAGGDLEGWKGKAFPLAGALVVGTPPFGGDTPATPP